LEYSLKNLKIIARVACADNKETGMRIPYRQQLGFARLGLEVAV
jgi:hypothetical protein